jgi:AcrR family transcriptional regulator
MSEDLPIEESGPAYRRAPAQKQDRLIAAARELFASQGYDETSTMQIAKRAGVSEGILFHHFGSKRGLFIRVAEDYARDVAAAILPGGLGDVTNEIVVTNAFAFVRANMSLHRLFVARGPELAELAFARQRDILVSAIEKQLSQDMNRGATRRGNARVMAELLYALVNGALSAWQLADDPSNEEEYIAETILTMQAMLAPPTM